MASELDKKATSIAKLNRLLREAGHEEQLVRGRGYFYFVDGNAFDWYTSSVLVNRLGVFTYGEWIEQRNSLAKKRD